MQTVLDSQIAQTYEVDDKKNIVVTPTHKGHIGEFLMLALVTLVLLYFDNRWPQYTVYQFKVTEDLSAPIHFLVIVPLVLLAITILHMHNTRLIICPDYLLYVRGRFSWRERSIRLDYKRIQEIEIDQTILQRFFGVGDVIVTPIATGMENMICIRGIDNPRLLKDLIRERASRTTT